MPSPNLTPNLTKIAPGVHTAEAAQRFFGMELGARMTVLESDGGLLVHSPIGMDPEAIQHLGTPRWVLAPNLFHHLYIGPFADAGLEAWCAPGLVEKRPDIRFQGVVTDESPRFGSDVQVLTLSCFSMSNEVVVLHRPSRTLVVTDLVFNIPATAPLFTRIAMRCACGYPGCRTTLLERIGMKRAAARRDLATILSWDFDRVIMAHGDIIQTGGKTAVMNAFRWLGRSVTGQLEAK